MAPHALPVVVIAGRPNVGKSTLFNRLAGRRAALVADTPGVTRDWQEAEALIRGRRVRLIDTAGLDEAAPDTLSGRMHASSSIAIGQADLVLFVVDARSGLTPVDRHFAQWLRRQGRQVLVIANKAEGRIAESGLFEAYALGLGDPVPVSAEHGEGIAGLMSDIAERLPDEAAASERTDAPLKLAIVGRPNAGKSTLLNRLVGEDRMVTGPEPGLTRDAVTVALTDSEGRRIELVDTAGLRRRSRIEAPLEKMSVGAAIGALRMAEMVVLAVDGAEGLHEQDLQIAHLVEREGRGLVIVLTKWDAVADRAAARRRVAERLEFEFCAIAGRAGARIVGGDRRRDGPAASRGLASLRGVEHAAAHGGVEPLVRGGAGPPPRAAGGQAAAEAALHHPAQGQAADLRGVRHPSRAPAGGLPPLPCQRAARDVRPGRHADPPAVARHAESVCCEGVEHDPFRLKRIMLYSPWLRARFTPHWLAAPDQVRGKL